jgi:UDP-glucose 4-epimerase
MRALVSGAGGFVGANLVRRLVADGGDVIALVRPGGDRWRIDDLSDDVEIVELDLADSEAVVRAATQQRPDVIFHLAAHGAYSWQQDLDRMLAVNVRCTQALLDAAGALGARLVHAGSSSEYGYKQHAPGEEEAARPNSLYAVTKLAATNLCALAADRQGTQALTLRLYSIYGPWEEPGRLMPTLVTAARADGWPPLVDRKIARDFVWVDDACRAFLLAATADCVEPGAVFNIASGVQTSIGELVATAGELFGVSAEPIWGEMQQRAWDTSVWVGKPERAGSDLHWRAETTLAEGLSALSTWFDAHPELEERYR